MNPEYKPKVHIVMYTYEHTGSESILGVFSNKDDAKMFIANFVLMNSVHTQYLEIVEREIE